MIVEVFSLSLHLLEQLVSLVTGMYWALFQLSKFCETFEWGPSNSSASGWLKQLSIIVKKKISISFREQNL